MPAVSASLTIESTEFTTDGIRVHWFIQAERPTRLNAVPFELRFHDGRGNPFKSNAAGPGVIQRLLNLTARRTPDYTLNKCAVFALLSVALPLLLLDNASITITCPWKWTDADIAYWEASLRRLGFDPSKCRFLGHGPEFPLRYQMRGGTPPLMGLFYGGGIESNAALAALLPYRPTLFIVEGPNWMNNNTNGVLSLKRKLEFEVAQRHQLDLVYARMNIREITPSVWDAMLNQFCTGGVFYWCAAAAGLTRGISLFIISQELEYTLIRDRFDQSLTPHQLFWGHHAEAPLLIPVMGWSSSLELFGMLRDSPLLESVYSCFHNSEHRWCGKCGKCYRAYECARRLGIDPARFGMLNPPATINAGSQLYRLHWQCADQLYPEPGRRGGTENSIGLTDVSLIDQVHMRLFRSSGGSVEFEGNEMSIHSESGPVEVFFDRLQFRGLDEFVCGASSAGGKWHISFELRDANGEVAAEWSRTIDGSCAACLDHSFPERFGMHTLIVRFQCLHPGTSEPARRIPLILRLPILRRKRAVV